MMGWLHLLFVVGYQRCRTALPRPNSITQFLWIAPLHAPCSSIINWAFSSKPAIINQSFTLIIFWSNGNVLLIYVWMKEELKEFEWRSLLGKSIITIHAVFQKSWFLMEAATNQNHSNHSIPQTNKELHS